MATLQTRHNGGCVTDGKDHMNNGDCYVTAILCIALAGCNPPQATSPDSASGTVAVKSTDYDNLRIIVRDTSSSEPILQPRNSISAGASADELPISTTQPPSQTEPTAFEQLETTTSEDGTVTVVLDDSFQSPLVATTECAATESPKSDPPPPEELNRTARKCAVSVRHQVPQKFR